MKYTICLFFFLLSFSLSAQQNKSVDFKSIESLVLFNQVEVDSTLYNSFEVHFDILKPTDSIFLNAVNMQFKNLTLNGKKHAFKNDGKHLIITEKFKPSKNNILRFVFFASPKKAMYFVGWDNTAKNQIWTQGQGKYTSNWLPSIDDMNEKITFRLTFAAPLDYQVISNGKLISKTQNSTYNLWHYQMKKPMSSYLVAVALGKYSKATENSKSGIPLEMYYYPEDSLKVEPTYRYTKKMFDYLEKEIGVAYPWQNYKQVPVHDFLYSGMENTSCTIFSDAFMVDEIGFADKNYVNVNAHELAHQWFGNYVTATSGKHHWLQEGFSTYYALLAEKEVFGEDYYYFKLFEYAQELATQERLGGNTALLNPKSSSTTFYKKGAWVLHLLREKVGSVAFQKAVKNYLNKHAFKNVRTKDFILELELASNQKLQSFVNRWLEDKAFYYEEAIHSLKKQSEYIQEYLMVDCETPNAKCDYYLKSWISDEAKSKIIAQIPERVTTEVFRNSIKVRQAIAVHLNKIPLALKKDYETLLNDKSYITIENALYNLWTNFPEDRFLYLNSTKNITGLTNKNVRLLWLALAIVTKDYKVETKKEYLNELVHYTSPAFNFEIRMQAFRLLESLQIVNKTVIKHYNEAEKHHNWRLQKFAKAFKEKNKENPKYLELITN